MNKISKSPMIISQRQSKVQTGTSEGITVCWAEEIMWTSSFGWRETFEKMCHCLRRGQPEGFFGQMDSTEWSSEHFLNDPLSVSGRGADCLGIATIKRHIQCGLWNG